MLLYGPNWAKFGPSLGQIGPKQPIFKVETRDFGSLYVFENTHHYQCIHNIIWAYTSRNLGQVDQNWVKCWAKFEPNWAQKSPIGLVSALATLRCCEVFPGLTTGKLHYQVPFFCFFIYIQWYILLIFFLVDFINIYLFDHTVFYLILITLFLI